MCIHIGLLMVVVSMCLLLSRTLCQDLLDSLLFLQKEGADDPGLEALRAERSTIGTGDGALSLFELAVGRLFQVLDSLNGHLGVTASWSLGGLFDLFRCKLSAGRADGPDLVGSGVVRMTPRACEAMIRHVCTRV